MAGLNFLLIGELVSLRSLCNASLQCAFDSVSCKIIRAIVQARAQQRLGLFHSNPAERLEISSIHATMLPKMLPKIRDNPQRSADTSFAQPTAGHPADPQIHQLIGLAVSASSTLR